MAPMATMLTEMSETQRQQALERYELIRGSVEEGTSQRELSQRSGVPVKTLQRWIRRYREHGLRGLARLTRVDTGSRRGMTQEQCHFIEGLALQPPRRSMATIHRMVCEVAPVHGWECPSYRRVCEVVRGISASVMTLAQEGKVAQRNRYDLVIRRESSRPNEIWQADHCWLGIWVLDEDGQAVRPWLTVVLDDYSRAIAGYRVTVSAPTALHSALTLRQAMLPKEHVQWPVYGVPQTLYTDHGKDLTSAHLEQVAAELKMQVLYSKIGQPRGRGKIERFMATVDEVLLQRLPGYSPKRKDQWPDEREAWEEKRRREARLSVREFARCFEEWVVQEYHQRRQHDLGGSPIERWEQGGFVPWLPQPRGQLDLLLLTVPRERKVRPEGIAFEGYWYRHTTLTAYVGEQVVIRYEPADMAEIRVYFERRFLCRAICEELGGEHISLHDLEQARKELRSRERGQVRERKKVVKRMGRPMEMERRAQEEERRTSQCEPSDQAAREILKRYEQDE